MKTYIILLVSSACVVLANPARTDCGWTKTFTATNNCGIAYGGTWVACAQNLRGAPTFTVPRCPPTETRAAIPTVDSAHAAITATPVLPNVPALRVAEAEVCRSVSECVDLFTVCGGVKTRYGACYNPCQPDSYPTPKPCTLLDPIVTEAAAPAADKAALEREHLAECDEKPWMCAPTGW